MSTQYVRIIKGFHRGNEVSGIFPVHKAYNQGKITVCAAKFTFGNLVETPQIRVDEAAFQYVDPSDEGFEVGVVAPELVSSGEFRGPGVSVTPAVLDYEAEFRKNETEEDAMNRIQHTFEMVKKVAGAVADGVIRGLVVSGPPGIGKSHEIEEVFSRRNAFRTLADQAPLYIVISGNTSPLGLYKTLWDYRDRKNTVIFDDCDGILSDETSLNLLKAALGSGARRQISWRSETRALSDNDIPNTFEFCGSVIFLTNVNFNSTRESKIKTHLNAIQSRCHYLDLEIGTQKDMLLRIKQVVRDGMLNPYFFTKEQQDELLAYVTDNVDMLNELSLRTVIKIADYMKAVPNEWRDFAEATCMKRSAKFKRRLAELQSVTQED